MKYFDIARLNMVKNQLMPNHVHDERILEAFNTVPRHEFVEGQWQSIAYSDARLPLLHGGIMLAPDVLARMISALTLNSQAMVLDIACGNGYSTAILSYLAHQVIGIEAHATLVEEAKQHLKRLGIKNVKVEHERWQYSKNSILFDAIMIHGAIIEVPAEVIGQLKSGGKLAYIEAVSPHLCKAVMLEKVGDKVGRIELFETFCEPLKV